MALNSPFRRDRHTRFHDRLDQLPDRLNSLRLRLRRSPNGLALGVFRGIAESIGWCVGWVRVLGCIVLLMVSSSVGAHGLRVSILVAGFFYLLAAVLMRPAGTPLASGGEMNGAAEHPLPPPMPARGYATRPAAVPYQNVRPAPRVDFAALDRQLDGLNRRIQRMEGIVTDRHYDWDRRMQG